MSANTPAQPVCTVASAAERVLLALADDRDRTPLIAALTACSAAAITVTTTAAAVIRAASEDAADVVLLDLGFDSELAGIVSTLLGRRPALTIVGLYGGQPSALLCQLVVAGVTSFVGVDAERPELAAVIAEARAGRAALDRSLVNDVLLGVQQQLRGQDTQHRVRALYVERLRQQFGTPGALRSVFQPIEDLHTRRRLGVLALTRFTGEPDAATGRRFDEAQSLGLTADLEIAAACEALRHVSLLPRGELLFIKISGETLAAGRLEDTITEEDASRIVLELTGHPASGDRDAFHVALEKLRDRGVRYSVDETGAGFGSLDHVLDLAPSFVRLAGGLTRNIDTDRTRRALALSVTSFATHLGARVIADVIETEDELRALRRLGVQYGVGYHIGVPGPMPAGADEPDGEQVATDTVVASAPTTLQWAHDSPTHIILPSRARRAFDEATRLALRALTDALPGWSAYVAHADAQHAELRIVHAAADELPDLETGLSMPLDDSIDGRVLAGSLPQTLDTPPDCEMARRLLIRTAVTVPFAGTRERPLATVSAVTRVSGVLAGDALELVRDAGAALAEALYCEHGDSEERVTDALRKLAWRDRFSGLFNRPRFMELLTQAQGQATVGGGSWLAVFKLCNILALRERHGHGLAELILKDVSRALATLAQPTDTLARVGPNTYACILYGRRVAEVDFLRRAVYDHVAASARARSADADLRSACEPLRELSAKATYDAAIERLFAVSGPADAPAQGPAR